MNIHCSKHSTKLAKYLCNQCGFICAEHIEEEGLAHHKLTLVDSDLIRWSYNSLVDYNKENIKYQTILQVKKQINQQLEKFEYAQQIEIRRAKANRDKNYKEAQLNDINIDILLDQLDISEMSVRNEAITTMSNKIRDMLINLKNASTMEQTMITTISILAKPTTSTPAQPKFGESAITSSPKKVIDDYYKYYTVNELIGIVFYQKTIKTALTVHFTIKTLLQVTPTPSPKHYQRAAAK
jgi:hypothetical protein